MRRIFTFYLLLLIPAIVTAQVEAPPDSILKKVENLKNVSAIKYLKKQYANGNKKSEGWAYLFQEGKKTKLVRLGHWKYYHSNGTLEFEDFMPVNDALPILEKHYNKEGILYKERWVEQVFDKHKNLTADTYKEVHYFPSGKIKSRSFYKSKKKINTWKWFDEEGNIINQKVYTPDN